MTRSLMGGLSVSHLPCLCHGPISARCFWWILLMKHFSDLCMRPAPNDLSPEPPRSNYSKHVFEGAQILAFLKSEPGYFPSLSSHKLLLLLLLLNLLTVNTKDLLLTNLLDSEALLHKRVNVFKKQNRFNYNFFPNQNPTLFQLSSVAQLCLTLQPHEPQHAKPPCPSPTPEVYSNSCPLSWWCHPTISSSVVPFSSCPQSFPASGSFPVGQLFTSGGQSIGVSASASVFPMNTQDSSPLGWTGWISLQSKGLSRDFSNATVQKHQFFSAQLSL